MQLSIIIPVYNVASYLEACLASVTQYTGPLEIIAVNDGATDDSPAILAQWAAKDARIRIISRENGGLSAARNTGLEAATGDYIWFVDSDDWIAPQALPILLEAIERQPAQMIAFSHIDYWEATATFSEAQYLQSIPLCTGREFIQQSHFFFTGAWSFLYQRSLLMAHGYRFKEGQLHEDDYLNFSLFGKVTEIYKLPQALYYYRRRPGSIITSTQYENVAKRIRSYLHLIQLLRGITDLDTAFLHQKCEAYERNLFGLLEKYLKTSDARERQLALVQEIKKVLPRRQLSWEAFRHSKWKWTLKVMYNVYPKGYVTMVTWR